MFWGQQNLLDPQSLNSYSYANNNPIVFSDPLGLAKTDYVQFPMSPGNTYSTSFPVDGKTVMGYYKGVPLYAGTNNVNSPSVAQCSVGVRRIYNQAFNASYGDKQSFASSLQNLIGPGSENFQWNSQGSLTIPRENDILVWKTQSSPEGGPGHAGIIAQVDFNQKTNSGTVWTIEQNHNQKTNLFSYPLTKNNNGSYNIDADLNNGNTVVAGWQHPLAQNLQVNNNQSSNLSGNSKSTNWFSSIMSRFK